MRSHRMSMLAGAALLAMAFGTSAWAAGFSQDVVQSYSQGEKASFLAGAHGKMGLNCATCHDGDKVSDSETEINAKCTTCHNPADLAKKTEKEGLPNPHKSHLGDVQCTACHSGHSQSVAYCTNCHDFPSMKDMKYGKGGRVPSQYEDLSVYADARPERTETTDILVVGSGAAGFMAAFTAQEAGVKNIIMVEKMAVPGGNSQLAAGGMNAAGTKYQKAAGIKDNPEMMFKDTMKGGKNVSNPALVKILAERSNESIEWLASRGAELSHVGLGGGASAARMHGPAGGVFVGPYLSKFFRDHARETKLDLRLNSKLVKLYTDDKGVVTGAAFELGLARQGRTLAELAANAGVDPKNLEATIAQYNKYAEAGKDPDFNRPGISAKIKVDTPPYYAIEITPAIHYYMGGLKFDEKTRVINKSGKPIEGLYAAGEVTGGVHGKNRLGGNSISETITFGRIAGESAAARVLGK